jgi:hypothetical protein
MRLSMSDHGNTFSPVCTKSIVTLKLSFFTNIGFWVFALLYLKGRDIGDGGTIALKVASVLTSILSQRGSLALSAVKARQDPVRTLLKRETAVGSRESIIAFTFPVDAFAVGFTLVGAARLDQQWGNC